MPDVTVPMAATAFQSLLAQIVTRLISHLDLVCKQGMKSIAVAGFASQIQAFSREYLPKLLVAFGDYNAQLLHGMGVVPDWIVEGYEEMESRLWSGNDPIAIQAELDTELSIACETLGLCLSDMSDTWNMVNEKWGWRADVQAFTIDSGDILLLNTVIVKLCHTMKGLICFPRKVELVREVEWFQTRINGQ